MLKLNEIQIGYNEKLFSISDCTIQKGVLYTLIGKNGSGKSSFFYTLLKQIKTFKGEIIIENQILSTIKPIDLAKTITFVPSKFDGVQHLTVYDYIALGRAPYTNFIGKLRGNDVEIIQNIVEKLKIKHLLTKDTTKISDGERQICALAKALVQETSYILLDEPCAFLDYENRLKIMNLLKSLVKELDVCIVQSSHDLELSMEFSDSFLLINSLKKELFCIENKNLTKETLINEAFGINLKV